VGEEALLEDVQCGGGGDTVAREVAGGDDDRFPEAADEAIGLTGREEEAVKGGITPAGAVGQEDLAHGEGCAGDFLAGEKVGTDERGAEVDGGGEAVAEGVGAEFGDAAAAFDPVLGAVPGEFVIDPEAAEKIEVVGAAAEGDVLAIVEHGAGADVDEAGGAAAELLAGFENGGGDAGLGEAESAGDAGDSAADDQHFSWTAGRGHGHQLAVRARAAAEIAMETLRRPERRTRRPEKTAAGSSAMRSRSWL